MKLKIETPAAKKKPTRNPTCTPALRRAKNIYGGIMGIAKAGRVGRSAYECDENADTSGAEYTSQIVSTNGSDESRIALDKNIGEPP